MQFIVVRGLATEPCMPPLFFQIPLLDHAMLTHQWKRLSAYWCEHSNVFTTRGIISSLRCQLWCDTNFAWVTIIMTTPWEETAHETRSAQFDLYTSKTERYIPLSMGASIGASTHSKQWFFGGKSLLLCEIVLLEKNCVSEYNVRIQQIQTTFNFPVSPTLTMVYYSNFVH